MNPIVSQALALADEYTQKRVSSALNFVQAGEAVGMPWPVTKARAAFLAYLEEIAADADRYRLIRPMLVAQIEEAASGRKGMALRPRLGRTFFDPAFQVPKLIADEVLNGTLDQEIDAAIKQERAK